MQAVSNPYSKSTFTKTLTCVKSELNARSSEELNNHLGSVLVIISDKRNPVCDQELGVSYFEAEVLAAYDYAPYGMLLPERTYSSDSVTYNFGFSNQMRDDEVYGFGNSYTAEYWQYDSRLGRRWNVDPRPVPSFSPYSCFANNPIWFSDEYGDSASQSSSPVQAVVNKGDSPSSIAQKNGLTLDELAKLNPSVFKNYENTENKSEYWKNADKNWIIHPGQKLNVRSNEPSNNLWQPSTPFTPEQMRQMYPKLFEVSSGEIKPMDFFEIPLAIVESAFNAAGVNEDYSGLIASIPFILINPKAFVKSAGKVVITGAAKKAGSLTIQFGKGAQQISHAFRHTDALGLNRTVVKSAVETHLKVVSSQIVAGKPFNQIIEVAGQRIQYTAFKLKDGTINIGRIHGVK